MSSCGYSNNGYENGGSFASQFENEFDMESLMNEQGFEGNLGAGNSEGFGAAESFANGANAANGSNGSECQTLPGRDRNTSRNISVQGNCFRVTNREFLNNFITRYNHYYVTNRRYVRNFVRDVNVVHCSTQTINCGCRHMGTTTVIANNNNGNNRPGCGCC
ncbi:MAG: hypothetical protein ACRDA5_02055 [Clostridium sp.]